MSVLYLKCIDRKLTLESNAGIYSGAVNSDNIKVLFDSEWSGATKTANFYRLVKTDKGYTREEYDVILNEDNTATIPHEVLTESGYFYIGVYGVKGDTTLTSSDLKIKVGKGANTSGL